MPQLEDPNFYRSTLLLFQFDKKGAMALVLNRRLELSLGQALEKQNLSKDFSNQNLFWGGPVENQQLLILHNQGHIEDCVSIDQKLFLSSSVESLKMLDKNSKENPDCHVRLFSGYAGWSAGQLEDEISQQQWLTAPISTLPLFSSDPSTLWNDIISSSGIELSQLSSLGFDPDQKIVH